MEVKLSPAMEKRLAEHIAPNGRYVSAEALVEEALKSWLDAAADSVDQEKLEAILMEGLESGPPTEMTQRNWTEIRVEAMKQYETLKRG